MMEFAYELIYVQEILVYLSFSWSGKLVFCRFRDFCKQNLLFHAKDDNFLRN